VRRILAEFRPMKSRTILLFERSTVTEAERERLRQMWAQVPPVQQRTGSKMPLVAPDITSSKPRTKYMVRFAERPTYPRHNRKPPKD
jgi:hypothetical protein